MPSNPVEPEPSSSAPLLMLCPSGRADDESDVIQMRADYHELILQHGIAAFQHGDNVFRVIRFFMHGKMHGDFFRVAQREAIQFRV